MTWKLLALPPLPEDAVRGLLAGLGDRVEVAVPARRDRDALLEALPGAEIVVGDWSGALALDAEAVRLAPRLAFVQQPSVGVDGHDLDALTAAGVPLANTAGVNAQSVAEWCLAAALALLRHLADGDREMRAGGWPQFTLQRRELSGARVGVVGFGPIGAACARLFGALGCRVSYWSRSPKPESYGAVHLDLDELVASSDVLVLAVPLAEETRGLIGAERLARMPAGSVLVNAARGGVVDQAALLSALESGHLSGAAVDVYEQEPPAADDPLRSCDRALLSPHAAGVTPQATTRLLECVTANLGAVLEGRPVTNVVNGVDPVVRRR
ncbi:2-hydroxyacid dehydrogenase [Microbispora sp. ATCC PTA-5024]|uniref:2-hydroxyacid dehydrogenase n=1 Tax=Microbispora sp. ATCC PTA-5024 TaxID=316330 RepID=UPI0003DBEE14|nr:2-hydroxyacid dehydrogenase [Microbispora sp. ATCC PTA-5024]ETK32111.1 3-phosphoglycerate dehydrogenase [Microbispora sp. ATCC PTA-5024]